MYDLQIIGLESDGAAAMASDLNGLNALMTNDNPYTVFVHCVCHSLNLAVSQVIYIYSYIQLHYNVNMYCSALAPD